MNEAGAWAMDLGYDRLRVARTDGQGAVGGAHEGCWYFITDLTHDPHAAAAVEAYAAAIEASDPEEAARLRRLLAEIGRREGC